MGGKIKVRVPAFDDAEIEKAITSRKARVPVKIVIVAPFPGNFTNLTDIVKKDFKLAEELFEQIGVKLEIEAQFKPLTDEQTQEIYDDDNIEFYQNSADLRKLMTVTKSNSLEAVKPTIFYVDSHINKNDEIDPNPRGITLPKDDIFPFGYGLVSALDRHEITLAHELGHLVGLASGSIQNMHHHKDAEYLLMRSAAEYWSDPIKSSLRFTPKDDIWIFEPDPSRLRLEAAKRYVIREDE